MDSTLQTSRARTSSTATNSDANYDAGARVDELRELLGEMDEAPSLRTRPSAEHQYQDHLIEVRLGMASGLFKALRARHPLTASHCLRVALGCSSWLQLIGLPEETRDASEIAALMHDIGKIGIPDSILSKPRRLEGDEILTMERHRLIGYDILASCCATPEIPELIHYSGAWYDGRKHGYDRTGDELPLGSRMIAIVDAYDAMTTDHVYRKAMSRERAMNELFEYAGSQFDPRMVKDFCQLLTSDKLRLDASVARRWLKELSGQAANENWAWGHHKLATASGAPQEAGAFHQRLLDTMHDGVIFVDTELNILKWNRAAERLTGIPASTMVTTRWDPQAIEMKDDRGQAITEENCPVIHGVGSGIMAMKRVELTGRQKNSLQINLQIVPVACREGHSRGVAIVMHDASAQNTLEEQVESLHKRATEDPLTKIANRAEFDRSLMEFVERHLENGSPCSLIICDLDFFKRINDEHGHQAGDDALISFSALLREHAREGDVVARYGGEEFVLLCEGCDNATATRRAEEIRSKLAVLPQPMLDNCIITASFGVTELQPGDSAELMLNRADRALLQAKDQGRNRVIQLGAGMGDEVAPPPAQKGWFDWFRDGSPDMAVERQLVTSVPIKLAAEKLRGFIADHSARLLEIDGDEVTLEVDGKQLPMRRRGDRPVTFVMQLCFREARVKSEGRVVGSALRTVISVTIRPKRKRDRRLRNIEQRALQLLVSMKSYFVAHEVAKGKKLDDSGVLRKARHAFGGLMKENKASDR